MFAEVTTTFSFNWFLRSNLLMVLKFARFSIKLESSLGDAHPIELEAKEVFECSLLPDFH